jgi:hypothetical protein
VGHRDTIAALIRPLIGASFNGDSLAVASKTLDFSDPQRQSESAFLGIRPSLLANGKATPWPIINH